MPARKLNFESGTLPVQHREYKIDQSKVDQEKRTCEILFSTDDPAERWWGNEILDHSPGACDLSRLNDGGAFLKDHDSRQQIGVHERATITLTQGVNGKSRGEGRALVRFAPSSNALAEQEFQDMLAGVRTKISVGYAVHAMQLIEEDADGNETWKITKWEPLENSLVAIPLDKACAAGRALPGEEEFPVSIDASIRNVEKNVDRDGKESQKREKPHSTKAKSMTPEEQKAADEKKQREDAAAKAEREQDVKEGMRVAREREKEINAIAKKANKNLPPSELEKALDDCVTNERAVENFRKLVFEKYFGNAEIIDTPSGQGGGDINGRGKNKGRSLGEQFIQSESFQAAAKGRGKRSASIEIEYPILGIRGKVAMAQRAGFTSSDLSAVNVDIQTGMIGLGVQRLTIMDIFAPGSTSAAAIIYPQETTFGTVDGVAVAAGAMPRGKATGERGVKPLWEPDLTTVTAAVKKIAITTKVPDEFMADFPASQSFIDERLPFMVDTETEFQMLYGDGLGNNLKGVTTFAGVQTRAITTTDDSTIAASLMKGLTDIRVNAFFEPDFYAFHPYDWETAKLLKDDSKRFLAGGPHYIPYTNSVFMELNTFWGKPVVVTTAVTYGKPLAGCGKLGAQYFIREGMRLEMTNANEDDFRRNLIMLRAEHRLALAVYRPVAFLEFTGMPART